VDALFSINFLIDTKFCPAVPQTCNITDRTLKVMELLCVYCYLHFCVSAANVV